MGPTSTSPILCFYSAEFQRGQYPDSVARGKLAAATSLPDDTVRVSVFLTQGVTNLQGQGLCWQRVGFGLEQKVLCSLDYFSLLPNFKCLS